MRWRRAATKAYVLSLTESLAEEMRGTGVTLTALCPGITATGMLSAAQSQSGALRKLPGRVQIRVCSLGFSGPIGFRCLDTPATLGIEVRERTFRSNDQPVSLHCRKHPMTQTTLRAVTLETVANYRQVAEHAVDAYRASGHRLLSAMSRGVDRAATRGAERIAPRWAAVLRRTSNKVTGVAAKGLDSVSTQTERVIERGSAGLTAQVGRVATLVEGIENRYIATGLQAAARISLSGAQAALSLSEKLVAGADKLSTAIEGSNVSRAKVIASRSQRTVASRGRGAVKSLRRAAAPAQSEVKTRVKAVARRLKVVASKAKATAKPVRARRAA